MFSDTACGAEAHVVSLGAALTHGVAAETRTITNGLEVHETMLILREETPNHLLTNESAPMRSQDGQSCRDQ